MTELKEYVKRSFSERAAEWAAGYADSEGRSMGAQNLISRQRFALEMLEAAVPRHSRVLDAGCGTGEMAAKLTERGYEVWGLDIAEPMIRHARDRCGSDRFRVGDIEHIPFPDNTFDAVVSLGVIEYLEEDEQALREMWRVLKPGSRAIVATPGPSPFYKLDRFLVRAIAVMRPAYYLAKYRLPGKPFPPKQPAPRFVDRRYHRRRWMRLYRALGFEPEEWICHGWGWYLSPVGLLTVFLSQTAKVAWPHLERFFGRTSVLRARQRFVRSRVLNWLGSEQIVRVRVVK